MAIFRRNAVNRVLLAAGLCALIVVPAAGASRTARGAQPGQATGSQPDRAIGAQTNQATGAQADRASQRPSFRATVERVRVDVLVTDREGRFVDDLGADDFVVYEDGAPQDIIGVQLVDLAAGTVTDLPIGAGGRRDVVDIRDEDALEGRFDSAATSTASEYGAIVFLVDLPGLDRHNKDRFARAWHRLLDETRSSGVPRAIYMIDQVGRLREVTPLTFSTVDLRRGAEAVERAPLTRPSVHEQLVREAERLLSLEAEEGNELRAHEAEERARAMGTFRLLTQFCNALGARRGRTALVWISSSMQLTEGGPGTALVAAQLDAEQDRDIAQDIDRSRRTGNTPFSFLSLDPQITVLQDELHRAANSANVSIYAVDPTPQRELRGAPFDVGVSTPQVNDLLGSRIVQSSLDGLRDAFFDAADQTGGRAWVGGQQIDGALAEIDRESSRFYLLSYAPPPPYGDGRYHDIRVEVRRPGLRVRERRGYVDHSPDDRRALTMAAALAVPGSVSGVPMAARVFRKWTPQGAAVAQLVVVLDDSSEPTRTVSAAPRAAVGSYRLHALLLRPNGDLVDEIHRQVRPTEAAESGAPAPFIFVHDWNPRPGEYIVRVAVENEQNGRIGASQIDLDVPRAERRWRTSDLMLAATDGRQQPLPLVNDRVIAGERILTYVEVVNGVRPVMSGDIFTHDGDDRFAQLPPLELDRDARGLHRGALQFHGVPPGLYTLQIVVSDAAAERHRIFRVPLQVLPRGRQAD